MTGVAQRTISSTAVADTRVEIGGPHRALIGVLREREHAVADRVARRLVAGRRRASRKNEPSSPGVSLCLPFSSSTSACIERGRDVVARVVEAVLREREAVLEQLHARGHELFERLHVLGIADAEDRVGELEDALGVGARDAEHVADDLQGERGRDLAHEVALAAERRRRGRRSRCACCARSPRSSRPGAA